MRERILRKRNVLREALDVIDEMLVQSQGLDGDIDEFGGAAPAPRAEETEPVGNVGKILYSSWGYEQTNVEFFKVVRETEHNVWLQRIGSKPAPGLRNSCPDQEYVVADETQVSKEPPQRCKKKFYGEQLSVRISTFQGAHEWNGKPLLATSYA